MLKDSLIMILSGEVFLIVYDSMIMYIKFLTEMDHGES